jgi:hypothetical protein
VRKQKVSHRRSLQGTISSRGESDSDGGKNSSAMCSTLVSHHLLVVVSARAKPD